MNRVLVTGADGFIGRWLVPLLISQGNDVLTFSISDGDISEGLPEFNTIDRVIHLAALTFVPESWTNTAAYYRVNVMGVVNALELCRKTGCGITFMSSYVYGRPQYVPIDEAHPVAPNTPYNHSKVLGEDLCRFYHEAFGVPVTVLRPFNIYGPGQSAHFLIPEIFTQLLDAGRQTVQLKDLAPQRDYIYVEDVVRALAVTVNREAGFEVFNLGSGLAVSVKELADACVRISGIPKAVEGMGDVRANEITGIAADIASARKNLGWEPVWSLDEGLSKTFRSMCNA